MIKFNKAIYIIEWIYTYKTYQNGIGFVHLLFKNKNFKKRLVSKDFISLRMLNFFFLIF